ncbi:Germin-like protein, partial [Thalictrum thalictroides]
RQSAVLLLGYLAGSNTSGSFHAVLSLPMAHTSITTCDLDGMQYLATSAYSETVEVKTVERQSAVLLLGNLAGSNTSGSFHAVLSLPMAHTLITTCDLDGMQYLATSAYSEVSCKGVESEVFVNGKFCKNPALVTAEDFTVSGLNIPGNTTNQLGSFVTPVSVNNLPGLNTLGVSLFRIDYAPYGLNPPHINPRATEVLVVMEGTLYVGFVTSYPDNRLISRVLYEGDVFVFPQGLIHFQYNIGKTKAVAFAGQGSQSPGLITIADSVFGSNPPISDDILAKAFQIDKKLVDYLQAKFSTDIN